MKLKSATGEEYRLHFAVDLDERLQGDEEVVVRTRARLHPGPCVAFPCRAPYTIIGDSRCRVELDVFRPLMGKKQAFAALLHGAWQKGFEFDRATRMLFWEKLLLVEEPRAWDAMMQRRHRQRGGKATPIGVGQVEVEPPHRIMKDV